jgi:predicted peroxiredoxin
LIVDGVHVGLKGYAEEIDIGEPFLAVKDLMEVYLAHGGELMACGACWKFNHLSMEEKMPEVKIITAADIVDFLMHAKSSLQLN